MKTGGGSAGRWRRLFPDDIVMKIIAALEGNTSNSLLLSANRRRIGETGDLCDSPLEWKLGVVVTYVKPSAMEESAHQVGCSICFRRRMTGLPRKPRQRLLGCPLS